MAKPTCTVPDCERTAHAKGWCMTHYRRYLRHGTPEQETRDPVTEFWAKVDKTGDCWEWTGGRNTAGYGYARIGRLVGPAHRHAYLLMVGPIPEGLTLDHLCRNRACVNPSHLEPVTQAENLRRARAVTTAT